MTTADAATWTQQVERALGRYDEALLRQVSERLFRPRNQWPAEELVARGLAAVSNAAAIDRRLQALEPAARALLALIGHSGQPRWRVGGLLEMLAMLGHDADLRTVLTLLEAGLLYPVLPESLKRLKSFEQWLSAGSAADPEVFAPPEITARALGEDLGLPACPAETDVGGSVREADGLEWPLRLAVAWQQVAAGPLRRTQSGEFFKRDFDRLRGEAILATPPADHLTELPDPGLLAVDLALTLGVLSETNGEITAAALPALWDQGLPAALASLWSAWPHLRGWDPAQGWQARQQAGSPYPSAALLALLLLSRLPKDGWADPTAVAGWVVERHPFWKGQLSQCNGEATAEPVAGLTRFLLGLAYEWRLVQAAKAESGAWAVRLAPVGRWVLGLGEAPGTPTAYPQTLLVQPNLEIIAYRQGLTPGLIAKLGLLAAWKSLGSACTLQLQPDTVYRALEAGQTFETLQRTLDQHGMRPTPPAVIESLRTWSNKRERLSVYASATLFEFASPEDLNEALARGLPAARLSERLAVVASESEIDFRHFRLTGTRDYALPPEQCVTVGDDGVTLTVDLTKSDLMLETELQRFAEPSGRPEYNGRGIYVLTPTSLAAARAEGWQWPQLEEWFFQRTGASPTPAARLLLNADQTPPPELRRQLVLHVSDAQVADGLMQWPQTRAYIQARLGPTALAVAEEDLDELRRQLGLLGIAL